MWHAIGIGSSLRLVVIGSNVFVKVLIYCWLTFRCQSLAAALSHLVLVLRWHKYPTVHEVGWRLTLCIYFMSDLLPCLIVLNCVLGKGPEVCAAYLSTSELNRLADLCVRLLLNSFYVIDVMTVPQLGINVDMHSLWVLILDSLSIALVTVPGKIGTTSPWLGLRHTFGLWGWLKNTIWMQWHCLRVTYRRPWNIWLRLG